MHMGKAGSGRSKKGVKLTEHTSVMETNGKLQNAVFQNRFTTTKCFKP